MTDGNSGEGKTGEGSTSTDDRVSRVDYDKAIERARNFEARFTDLEKRFTPFKDLDIDTLKIKAAEHDKMLADSAKKGDKKDVDALIAQARSETESKVRGEFDPELKKRDEAIQKLTSSLKELQVVEKVFSSNAGKIVDSAHDDFKDIVRKMFDQDEQGRLYVKGKYSNRDGQRDQWMGPDEFMEELEKTKPHLFKAKGTQGFMNNNGQHYTPQPNGNGTFNPQAILSLPPDQQKEAIAKLNERERGQLTAMALGLGRR